MGNVVALGFRRESDKMQRQTRAPDAHRKSRLNDPEKFDREPVAAWSRDFRYANRPRRPFQRDAAY